MAKKKKEEEHENLERWLVSYADFMTLIFATFVVLYALSQIDAAEYEKLQESIKEAFNNLYDTYKNARNEEYAEAMLNSHSAFTNCTFLVIIVSF